MDAAHWFTVTSIHHFIFIKVILVYCETSPVESIWSTKRGTTVVVYNVLMSNLSYGGWRTLALASVGTWIYIYI